MYQDLLKRSKEVVGIFDLNDSMKEVTMSMYPGATSHPAHWKSFADIANITSTSDVEGLSGESDSDSGEISEWVLGLSTLILAFRWRLRTCIQGNPLQPRLAAWSRKYLPPIRKRSAGVQPLLV